MGCVPSTGSVCERHNWAEMGGSPIDEQPARRGFGTHLLERALTQDLGLGSSVELQFAPAGLRTSIRFTAKLPRTRGQSGRGGIPSRRRT
jgi:two-component sensor histidine kinase